MLRLGNVPAAHLVLVRWSRERVHLLLSHLQVVLRKLTRLRYCRRGLRAIILRLITQHLLAACDGWFTTQILGLEQLKLAFHFQIFVAQTLVLVRRALNLRISLVMARCGFRLKLLIHLQCCILRLGP